MSNVLIAGATGLLGSALQKYIITNSPQLISQVFTARRPNVFNSCILPDFLSRSIVIDDLSSEVDWQYLLGTIHPSVIVLISNIRHLRPLLNVIFKCFPGTYRPRLIVVGTTGVFSHFPSYSLEYLELEEKLSVYNGPSLLLRPSMIYGSNNDKNMHKVIHFIRRFKFFPIFGSGDNLLQPVYYMDIVRTLHFVIINSSLSGTYNLTGLYPITYKSLILEIFEQLGIKPRIVHLPLRIIAFLMRLLPSALATCLPFSEEQVMRLSEDKFYPHNSSVSDLNYSPHSFVEGISKQINL